MKSEFNKYARKKKNRVDPLLRDRIKKDVGERLRQLRNEKGWSLKDAVQALIMQPSTPEEYRPKDGCEIGEVDFAPERLKQWEYGDNAVDPPWYTPLCEMYGCDLDYLFGQIPTKRHRNFETSELTGLSEEAIGTLTAFNLNDKVDDTHLVRTLNRLLPLPEFKKFLKSCNTYALAKSKIEGKKADYRIGATDEEMRRIIQTQEWRKEEAELIEAETGGLFTLATIDTVPLARELDAQHQLHAILETLAQQYTQERNLKKDN